MEELRHKAVAVVGPTASGKTALAIRLARLFDGEIVSADSRQLYRGMTIGADTPEGEDTEIDGLPVRIVEGLPHHLFAVRNPDETVTLAEWREMALERMRSIVARGKVPFIVGGTGLYIDALTKGMAIPEVPPNATLRTELDALSTDELYGRLVDADPAYAERIPKENRRYVIRALEVIAATGERFSSLQEKRVDTGFDFLTVGIERPREEAYARIDARVDDMMTRGLLDEVRDLSGKYGWDLPSMSGLGYRQFREYLETGERHAMAVDAVKRETRRYAKRQMTWLRRNRAIEWVDSEAMAEGIIRPFLAK